MKQIIIIPARMKGTRLPGKPLILINGLPLIQHVWDRCIKVHESEFVFVATEDEEINLYCKNNGINCILTPNAETAIDRIKFVSDIIYADGYINVQGDEPIVNIEDIKKILLFNRDFPDRVVFGKTVATEQEFNDFSKAKVVCDKDGRLMYSSRAGIPINNKGKFVKAERAIWIYGFNKIALDAYHENSGVTTLDTLEDNEIIRFLELGIPVYCIDLIGNSWAVDEFKDIKIVEEKILLENSQSNEKNHYN
jgi:3-deoxy-manno-octulosonate cytidylyltransferase (CMP-KDO synthetase)